MKSPVQIARRIYRDLVVRRSAIRIQAAQVEVVSDYPPIFIIGVYRSGTTLLRYLVDSHSRICCPPESDFVLALSSLATDQRSLSSLDRMGFDEDHVIGRMRSFADYFFVNYARTVGKPRWADKTPAYVDCLDVLLRMYPQAKFLFIYRDGLNQSHSMTRGGTLTRPAFAEYCEPGEDLRIGAMRYWAQQVRKMLEFERLSGAAVLRIRYEDLCEQPSREMRRVFEFVGEDYEPDVLDYSSFDHTIGSEDGTALSRNRVTDASVHTDKWDSALVADCRRIGQEQLGELGYASADRVLG